MIFGKLGAAWSHQLNEQVRNSAAQLVKRWTLVPKVPGSHPARNTTYTGPDISTDHEKRSSYSGPDTWTHDDMSTNKSQENRHSSPWSIPAVHLPGVAQ